MSDYDLAQPSGSARVVPGGVSAGTALQAPRICRGKRFMSSRALSMTCE
jgi:hypothetical protein